MPAGGIGDGDDLIRLTLQPLASDQSGSTAGTAADGDSQAVSTKPPARYLLATVFLHVCTDSASVAQHTPCDNMS